MADLQVRKAEDSDADAIAALMGELGYPMAPAVALERVRTLSSRDDSSVLVALLGQGVVGVAGIHRIPLLHRQGTVGRIIAFVVSVKHRGQGVGTHLLRCAEEGLWSQGCERIEITSGDSCTDAHRFYRQAGYEMMSQRFLKHRDNPPRSESRLQGEAAGG